MKIKIIEVKEMQSATTKQKFMTYKTVDKNGRKMDLKFRKEVNTKDITGPCTLVIEDAENVNVDTTKQYPCVWVRGFDSIEETERKSNVGDFFDVN